MNFQEIKARLEEKGVTPERFAEGDWNEGLLDLGEVKLVDQYGGEGQGETYYNVWHLVEHDVYIRVDAFYSSYGGPDYDGYDFTEVKPVEKTITVYL